ncbi:MAG: radical SAM protein, partial [Bacillota bacterium]
MNDLENKVFKLQRINLVVTKLCNLHCRMCDVPELNFWENDMTLVQIKEIIKEAAVLGAHTLELSGGEPMMRKDIYEIISFAVSHGLKVFMATNGVLMGPGEVEKLLEAGLTLITFSLEGPEQLNDLMRGQGSYQKTLNAIQGFLNRQISGLQVMIGITLSRYNYQFILPFSKYLIEEVGVFSISINPYNPMMLTPENRKTRNEEFNIPGELIPDLSGKIEQLIQYAQSVPGRLPTSGYLSRIPDYFMGKKLIPPGGCSIPLT